MSSDLYTHCLCGQVLNAYTSATGLCRRCYDAAQADGMPRPKRDRVEAARVSRRNHVGYSLERSELIRDSIIRALRNRPSLMVNQFYSLVQPRPRPPEVYAALDDLVDTGQVICRAIQYADTIGRPRMRREYVYANGNLPTATVDRAGVV